MHIYIYTYMYIYIYMIPEKKTIRVVNRFIVDVTKRVALQIEKA